MTRTRQRTPRNFYPRPPRGGRRNATDVTIQMPNISTHALREEGDLHVIWLCLREFKFLPTPSARRATLRRCLLPCRRHISTHALREEGDAQSRAGCKNSKAFLPTPSARRATPLFAPRKVRERYFYPRPPRGGRPTLAATVTLASNFYPRPPRGGRPYNWSVGVSDYLISTHALREEGDLRLQDVPELYAISTHALREEGDVMSMPSCVEIGNFYPRPPRGGRQMDKERGFE